MPNLPPIVWVPNWLSKKLASARRVVLSRPGSASSGLGECPPPALAVVLGPSEALGNPVIDRRPVRLDGRRGLLAAPDTNRDSRRSRAETSSGVRLWSRQESLVVPLPMRALGERQEITARRARDRGRDAHDPVPCNKELQGAGPIALVRADESAAVRDAGRGGTCPRRCSRSVPGRSDSSRPPPGATASLPGGPR